MSFGVCSILCSPAVTQLHEAMCKNRCLMTKNKKKLIQIEVMNICCLATALTFLEIFARLSPKSQSVSFTVAVDLLLVASLLVPP